MDQTPVDLGSIWSAGTADRRMPATRFEALAHAAALVLAGGLILAAGAVAYIMIL